MQKSTVYKNRIEKRGNEVSVPTFNLVQTRTRPEQHEGTSAQPRRSRRNLPGQRKVIKHTEQIRLATG